jgi:AcrR family transcriptional regulator
VLDQRLASLIVTLRRKMSQRHSDAALLDAARACVAERGIARTTVSDVARRAGASRMTVYRTFPDAATLWSSLLTREIGSVVADAEAAAASLPTARERLIDATARAVVALRNDPVIRRVLELDSERLLPYLTVRRGHAQEIAIAAVRGHLAAGRRDGSIRDVAGDAVPRLLELLVRSLLAASPALIDDALTPAIDAELRVMLDTWLRPAEPAA